MSIDIEQFHAVFFDESQEHLDDMEQLLMELDVDDPDLEQLNSIFRAAHSIKGGSGIFGFDALTGLTHVMENLLDKARNSTIKLDVPTVDLFLETVDLLKVILDAYKSQSDLPDEGIQQGVAALEEALAKSAGDASPPQDGEPAVESASQAIDDGFGFFDDDEPAADDGFGFFDDDEPVAGQQAEEGTIEPVASAVTQQDMSDSFGFYDESALPAKPDDSKPYGFYKPVEQIRDDVKSVAKGNVTKDEVKPGQKRKAADH